MSDKIAIGSKIEHNDMPGFVMDVLEIKPCEGDDCESYRIIDPEGNEDWLCSRDVHAVGN